MTSAESDSVRLLLDSIDAALRLLATMPTSAEVRELCQRAADYQRVVTMWLTTQPSAEKREDMAQRVLALHAMASKM